MKENIMSQIDNVTDEEKMAVINQAFGVLDESLKKQAGISSSSTYDYNIEKTDAVAKWEGKTFNNKTCYVIGKFETGDDMPENSVTYRGITEREAWNIAFIKKHPVIIISALDEKDAEKMPENIAVVIGDYNITGNIISDLEKEAISITQLLLNFEIKTHHPHLFPAKELRDFVGEYLTVRYNDDMGIIVNINVVESDPDADNPDDVYFEIDMKSNLPTTVIHNDIMALLGSKCLEIEFEYNTK